jgi:hypothetical protein
VIVVVSLTLYFLPTIIRASRGEPALALFFANLIFGWTGIGWLIVFCSAWSRSVRIVINNTVNAAR